MAGCLGLALCPGVEVQLTACFASDSSCNRQLASLHYLDVSACRLECLRISVLQDTDVFWPVIEEVVQEGAYADNIVCTSLQLVRRAWVIAPNQYSTFSHDAPEADKAAVIR